jgi:hypothetical protein
MLRNRFTHFYFDFHASIFSPMAVEKRQVPVAAAK